MPSCLSCQHLNSETAKFCSQCGTALEKVCSRCQTKVDLSASFCPECGTKFSSAAVRDKASRSAEHRYTSVLFSDLAGSTQLAEQLDPETLHDVIGRYHDLVSKAVERYEGHVAKFLGDGVMAFFGYPVAHEDDCKRSILAGLSILESLSELNKDLKSQHGVEIAVRVGIHSGSVIAGEMGNVDRPVMDIVGETPNIAARIQEIAEPNTVVVSDATYRPTEFSFHFEFLGARSLKGVSKSIRAFRVLSSAENKVRFQPMIGRTFDFDLLWSSWIHVREGQGRLAIIRGEAGIGKSTLVNTLMTRCGQDALSAEVELLRCSPYHQTTPFYPIVEHLRGALLHINREDSNETQLERLVDFVESRGFSASECVPILAPLLSIPFETKFVAPLLSPEGRRIRTMEIMVEMLSKRTVDHPVVLVIDDIHWADPSTIETLDKALHFLGSMRMFIIVTSRPHYIPTIQRPPGTLEITLDRLDNASSWNLAKSVAGDKTLPIQILQYISDRTDGIPLFVEELTKTIIESGAVRLVDDSYELVGELTDLSIPTTLQGSLIARLERVSERKEVAQVAAVIGREFNLGVVAAVMKENQTHVANQLSKLVSADLVYQIDSFAGKETYRFRHALIQDAAYDSLLRSVRQQYHGEIARTLESQFVDSAEEQPEIVANHYSAAGAVDAALTWWSKAGQKALGRSANLEAISHFTSGLELLQQLQESPEKIQLELAMLTQRGMALIATKGFGAKEVGSSFQRAEQICQLIGETPLLFPVLWGLWVFSLVRSNLEESIEHADQMLRLAKVAEDPNMWIEGHFTRANSLFWLGRLQEAKDHADSARQLYDREQHSTNILLYGQDPGVSTLCYTSYIYWALGYPEQALRFSVEAMDLAESIRHPFSIGWSLAFGCTLRNWMGDFESAKEWSLRCSQYCSEQGQAFWASASVASLGWAEFYTGEREQGLEHIKQGLLGYELTGSITVMPLWRAVYAEALFQCDELDRALEVCNEGLQTLENHHEWFTEPYLRTVKGQILAKKGDLAASVVEINRAFEQAESQNSRMRALQAATRLLEIDPTEAHFERLQRTYDWFSEGFETRHLVDAKAQLESFKASI
jgi:class 3 adenylate cyclase/tetratricopeptide (TPR) repeat protein